jgi:TetR/AcrR family transcriptional regulator, fatty acid metabolism regulator protein
MKASSESFGAEAATHQTKTELIRDFRVRQILGAVYEVAAERGFKGTTMTLVAQKAGVAKGTLYVYFESKQDLLSAALEHLKQSFNADLRAKIKGIKDPVEKLYRLVLAEMEYAETQRDFIKSMFLERNFLGAPPRDPEASQLLEMYLSGRRLHEKVIEEGIRAGAFRAHDVGMSALMLYEAFRGLFQLHPTERNNNYPTKDARLLLDILLHGIAV